MHPAKLFLGSVMVATLATGARAADPVPPPTVTVPVTTTTGADSLFSVYFGGTYLSQPVVNGLGAVIDDGPYDFIAQPDNGFDLSGLGIVGGLEFWGRLYLGAEFTWAGDSAASVLELPAGPPTPYLDTLPIDGSTSPGAIVSGGGAAIDVTSDANFIRFSKSLGYVLPTTGPRVAIGLYGSFSRLDFNAQFAEQGGTDYMLLDETVRAYSVGPMVALRQEFQLGPNASAYLQGRAAILYSHGALDAYQEASNIGTPLTVTDTHSNLAGLVEMRVGVDLMTAGNATIGLFAGASVRNDTYRIVNPRSGPGLNASNPASYNPGPAHILPTWQWGANVGITLSVSIN